MLIFSSKMHDFGFKMLILASKCLILISKCIILASKYFIFSFKMVICRLKIANLNFQKVPGQDLAENGPFACKPHKENIKKNTAFALENLPSKTVQILRNGRFYCKMVGFGFKMIGFNFEMVDFSGKLINFRFKTIILVSRW